MLIFLNESKLFKILTSQAQYNLPIPTFSKLSKMPKITTSFLPVFEVCIQTKNILKTGLRPSPKKIFQVIHITSLELLFLCHTQKRGKSLKTPTIINDHWIRFKTFSEKYTKIQLMLIILTRKKIKIKWINNYCRILSEWILKK